MHERSFRRRGSAQAAERGGRVLALVLCASVWVCAGHAQQAAPERPVPTIVVSGEGRVAARPDMATITIGIERDAPSAAEAMAAMSEAATSVLAAIEALGLAGSDVQTGGFDLAPRYAAQNRIPPGGDRPVPVIVGYVAATSLRVRVRDLDALGPTLDTVVGEGANALRGLSFGVQDPMPHEDEARRRAVADAARQAALLAEAAGVSLGALLRIDTEGGGVRPMMMRSEAIMADGAGVPVAPGEIDMTARVRLEYAFGVE